MAKIQDTQLFIGGKFVNSVSGKTFPVINPATEEVICEVQEALDADIDLAVKAANDALLTKNNYKVQYRTFAPRTGNNFKTLDY